MSLMDEKSAALARNPETGSYAFLQRIAQDGLTADGFCDALTSFVDTLETWRTMLENFRPVAEEAKASAAAQPDAHDMSMSGFMQV